MFDVKKEFKDRVNEIDAFFNFIESIDCGDIQLIDKKAASHAYSTRDKDDVLRTFKASAFLLLYNLMESTVTNAIEAIFDEMKLQNTHFDLCSNEIRCVVLDNLKQHKSKDILPSFSILARDIISKTFKKDGIVSGNVDAKKIREIANYYGFRHPSANGEVLTTVKSNRNDLAHGVKSFSEVGRAVTVSEIVKLKDQVIQYLDAMLASIEDYITKKRYLGISNAS
jgi:hypothetical protein